MPATLKQRAVSVAALQLQAHDRGAFSSVWPQISHAVQTAAAGGAQLIVLPEGTVPAYFIGSEPVDSRVTERAISEIQAIARRTKSVIVYGSLRFNAGLIYNSALVVDSDGALAGYADKCFLWHFDRRWFAPGALRRPVQTSLGILGVMICADGRIPTIARSLVDDGAELLVMPTAWVTSGRDEANLENVQADLLARVRALENGVPFVAANKAGVEAGCVAYCGKSQILDADGAILAIASEREPETLYASVTLGTGTPSRSDAPQPPPAPPGGTPLRIALTPFTEPVDAALLTMLGADAIIGADGARDRDVRDAVAAASVNDAIAHDPGGLVPYRLAGYELIVWRAGATDRVRQRNIARARALELRLYVVCIVKNEYAFAVDPDGIVVCGTFDGLRLASFAFLPERTHQTLVAPGTDILEGLKAAQRAPEGVAGVGL